MRQTFGQKLATWMRSHELTITSMTEQMGFSSRTSIHRLLADEASFSNAQRFFEQMKRTYTLSHQEEEGLRCGIEHLQYGLSDLTFWDRLDELLAGKCCLDALPRLPIDLSRAEKVEAFLFGCQASFQLIHALLAEKQNTEIWHVIQINGGSCEPSAILPAFELLCEPRYHLYIPVEASAVLPDNIAFLKTTGGNGEGCHLLLLGQQPAQCVQMESGFQPMELLTGGNRAIPFFSTNLLSKSTDYIAMLQESYKRERNRECVIAKLTPPMQCIPDDILYASMRGSDNARNIELMPSVDTLKMLVHSRYEDYVHKKAKHALILSLPETEQFFSTGRMTDHPHGFRTFTEEERLRILQTLRSMTEKERFSLYFTSEGILDRISMEIYPKRGVLLFPSRTSYRTRNESFYREVFWEGARIAELFSLYVEKRLLPRCAGGENTSTILEKLEGQIVQAQCEA